MWSPTPCDVLATDWVEVHDQTCTHYRSEFRNWPGSGSTFLEKDYQVYGVDQGENPLLEDDFHFLQRDLTLDLEPVFDWCPQVDILCNTAGVLDDYKPLLEQSAQEIQEIFEINYVIPVELTRYYLTQMLENKKGIIINMCSIASSLAGGGGHAYTSSKHALAGFTKQLALDYAEAGIQVFGIAPGAVKTAMSCVAGL